MNIGQASKQAQLPAETIRRYAAIDLVCPQLAANGHRDYSDNVTHRQRLLQRARSLGFSIEKCRMLRSLCDDEHRESSHVKSIAKDKSARIDLKIEELVRLRQTLANLSAHCHGDDGPGCPIIDDRAGGGNIQQAS